MNGAHRNDDADYEDEEGAGRADSLQGEEARRETRGELEGES